MYCKPVAFFLSHSISVILACCNCFGGNNCDPKKKGKNWPGENIFICSKNQSIKENLGGIIQLQIHGVC